jgi:hypothetical protein
VRDEEQDHPGYLGAMLDQEQRLVLVPVDPERPWVAFRRMRSWMKHSRKGGAKTVDVFKPPPFEGQIIELPRRDDREA